MSYSPPSIGPSGLIIPSYLDILNYLIAQYQGIYGSTVYLGADSSDYQFLSVLSLMVSDVQSAMQQVDTQFSPILAIGVALDMIGTLIGTPRKISTFSTASVLVSGTPGATITNGVCQDTSGNYWNLPLGVTIGGGGTVTVTATAAISGIVTANPNTITIISTATAGWTSVTNPSAAVPGSPVEPDSQYRARLVLSQALPSSTLLAGTAAAIAATSGVTRSMVYENTGNSTDSLGNPAHSLTCVVEGGVSTTIAQSIYNNKGIGCLTNGKVNNAISPGTTTVTITDPNNGSLSQPISFLILEYLNISVGLNIHPLVGFTSVIQAAIATNVIAYLNSLGIGEPVVWGELFGAALNARPNPDQPTFAIYAVQDAYQSAQTTATLNSTTTIVVSNPTGIVVGQIVFGAGIQSDSVVASITGTSVVLSLAATATASGVTVTFFTPVSAGTTISVPFYQAASGQSQYVGISLV